MAYFQFPWRLLGPALLCLCFVSASLKPNKFFLILIILSSFYLNYSYFREDIWFNNLSDTQKLTGANLVAQQGAGLKDFYPKFSLEYPKTHHQIYLFSLMEWFNWEIFKKTAPSLRGIYLSIHLPRPLIYRSPIFPEWNYVSMVKSSYRIDPILGLIQFDLPQGRHYFYLRFSDTPIRSIANLISVFTLLAFIIK